MDSTEDINLLVVVMVSGAQSNRLMNRLRKEDFRFTQVDSSGGFLHDSTLTLFVGTNQSHLQSLLRIIRKCCHRKKQFVAARIDVLPMQGQPLMIEAEVGGATVFAFEVDHFEQLG